MAGSFFQPRPELAGKIVSLDDQVELYKCSRAREWPAIVLIANATASYGDVAFGRERPEE
jgi:hypothetical protein